MIHVSATEPWWLFIGSIVCFVAVVAYSLWKR